MQYPLDLLQSVHEAAERAGVYVAGYDLAVVDYQLGDDTALAAGVVRHGVGVAAAVLAGVGRQPCAGPW